MDTTIKRCHVCDDKASAFNHNGLSCHSCKMFFRRNIAKLNNLKCKYEDGCKIDKISRKFCSKCRLNKCLAIGMSEQSIGKITHKAKIKEVDKDINDEELMIKRLTIRSIMKSEKLLTTNPPINFKPLAQKFTLKLCPIEREKISEIQNAIQIFGDETKLSVRGEVQTKVDAFNLHANYGKRIVKFCKNIQAFKNVNSVDQLTILKAFYFEIHFTRLAFNFGPKETSLRLIGNESGDHTIAITQKFVLNETKFNPKFRLNLKFKNLYHEQMENDCTIRDLIITQFLFKPRENIESVEFVSYQHNIYTRLLLRYLEHKYRDVDRAKQKYSSIMDFLENVNFVRLNFLEVVSKQIDLSKVNELLREVFEL